MYSLSHFSSLLQPKYVTINSELKREKKCESKKMLVLVCKVKFCKNHYTVTQLHKIPLKNEDKIISLQKHSSFLHIFAHCAKFVTCYPIRVDIFFKRRRRQEKKCHLMWQLYSKNLSSFSPRTVGEISINMLCHFSSKAF